MLSPMGNNARVDGTLRPPQPPAVLTTYGVREPEPKVGDPAGLHTLTALLWRWKLTIVAVAIFGLMIGIAAGVYTKPVYRARTSLQLEGLNDQAFPVSPQLPNASPENYLQNEVKVLESDTLARRIGDKLKATSENPSTTPAPGLLNRLNDWLRFGLAPHGDPTTATERRTQTVKKALTVRTSLQSQVIELFFDAPNPKMAELGANAAASEFINLNREARSQMVQDTTEWLNKQAAELKARLESSNRQLQQFASESGLLIGNNQSTPAQDRMRQIQEALTRAEADRAAKQARYEASTTGSIELLSDGLASGTLRQYEVDLQTMHRQLADLRTIYTPDNLKITRLEAQIAESDAAITKERNSILGRMRTEYSAAGALERALSLSLTQQLTRAEQQTEEQLQYNVLKNEIETNQRLYNSVLEKAKDAGAASSLRMTNIRVIDTATRPSAPYSPNLPLNMALGLGIGAMGGIGLALLVKRPDKVQQPSELMFMNLPELGVVPAATGAKELDIYRTSAMTTGPGDMKSSLLKESFRTVLTSILFSNRIDRGSKGRTNRPGGRTLVVTSVDVMEGKTTIVTHLGIASAECNREVLLVDADLRRPRLHERFNLPNDYGLTDLLGPSDQNGGRENPALEALVQATHIPHLWVLTSGPVDASSPNALRASDLRALMQRFERQFDLVFVDVAPMLLFSDARVLGRTADGVVMVIRANTKTREELTAAYQQLVQDRIHVLGTILNDWKIDPAQARAYGRYYAHYQLGGGQ
jgi:succinoglycan biosynthesis transport protein ExoP